MNNLHLSKLLKYGEGDRIRGIAEPYVRSIYRVIRIDNEGVHTVWESLRGHTDDETIERGYKPLRRLLRWVVEDKGPQSCEWEDAFDFRLATREEIERSRTVRE